MQAVSQCVRGTKDFGGAVAMCTDSSGAYLTLREVASIVGVTKSCVGRWVRTGRLKAETKGSRYFVDQKDLSEFRKSYSRRNSFIDSPEIIQICLNCNAKECKQGTRSCGLRGKKLTI